MTSALTLILFAAVSITNPRAERRCEIVGSPNESSLADSVRVLRLIADATVIVRARAVAVDTISKRGGDRPPLGVRFDVLEVLKGGASIPRALIIKPAELTEQDEFNPRPVPYATVRPSGLRGSCFATAYRRGAQYLLFLRASDDGTLSPYWAPLAPTNEELREPGDPWLLWVRAHYS